jgi:UMF1 family MFS transporter
LREGEKYPGLVRFLVGRVFYTDAINTVILVMVLVARNVLEGSGDSEEQARTTARFVMLWAITFAVAGGLIRGRLVDRLGPKRTLNIVLYLWLAIFSIASPRLDGNVALLVHTWTRMIGDDQVSRPIRPD